MLVVVFPCWSPLFVHVYLVRGGILFLDVEVLFKQLLLISIGCVNCLCFEYWALFLLIGALASFSGRSHPLPAGYDP